MNNKTARWIFPAVILGLLWVLLTGGDIGSWLVGVPSVLLAVIAFNNLNTGRPLRLRASRLPAFIAWFVWHSLKGGADVAWRAVHPGLPLHPGFVSYRLLLAPGPARTFLVNCVSLLPGTLSAELVDDELLLHALDTETDVIAGTQAVEQQVDRLFGRRIHSAHG